MAALPMLEFRPELIAESRLDSPRFILLWWRDANARSKVGRVAMQARAHWFNARPTPRNGFEYSDNFCVAV